MSVYNSSPMHLQEHSSYDPTTFPGSKYEDRVGVRNGLCQKPRTPNPRPQEFRFSVQESGLGLFAKFVASSLDTNMKHSPFLEYEICS